MRTVGTAVFTAFLSAVAAGAGSAVVLFHETFELADPISGLPPGWSKGPPAHLPFFTTAVDRKVYGVAPPALRIDLPLQVLNYWVASPRIPLRRLDADYTLRLALRVEQPDAPLLVEAATFDREGRWLARHTLLNLAGQRDDTLRTYRVSFHAEGPPGGGLCAILIGLPYTKTLREGRVWLDDVELSENREASALDLFIRPLSVDAGGRIEVHISSGRGQADLSIFREADRQVLMDGPQRIAGLAEQPIPPDAAAHGCGWPVSAVISIPIDWPSGVYLVKADDGDRTVWTSFTVRGRGDEGPLLVVLPTHTEQAYNGWGGASFYSRNPTPAVSFERPMDISQTTLYTEPIHLIRWLSREGIGFAVASDDDLHHDPGILFNYPGIVIAGHSEYWSRSMREGVEAYIRAGGCMLCLSGNTCWWQTRVEEDAPGRRLICYKYAAAVDPYQTRDPDLVTTHWDEPPVSDSPARFLGLSWRWGGMVNWSTGYDCPCAYDWLSGHGGYTAYRTDHWAFEGTGLTDGDPFGQGLAIVGYEVDGAPIEWVAGRPHVLPRGGTPAGFLVLGHAPCWNQYAVDSAGVALMGILERDGSLVWNAGTTGWCWGLAGDPNVQAITRNLIRRLPASPPRARSHRPTRVVLNPSGGRIVCELEGGPIPSILSLYSATGGHIVQVTPIPLGPGRALLPWNGRDGSGRETPSGVYWLRIPNGGGLRIVRVR